MFLTEQVMVYKSVILGKLADSYFWIGKIWKTVLGFIRGVVES